MNFFAAILKLFLIPETLTGGGVTLSSSSGRDARGGEEEFRADSSREIRSFKDDISESFWRHSSRRVVFRARYFDIVGAMEEFVGDD